MSVLDRTLCRTEAIGQQTAQTAVFVERAHQLLVGDLPAFPNTGVLEHRQRDGACLVGADFVLELRGEVRAAAGDEARRGLYLRALHTNAFVGINNGSTPFGPMIAHVRRRFAWVIFESCCMFLLPTCRHTVGDHASTY
jgi:hypothetical protein